MNDAEENGYCDSTSTLLTLGYIEASSLLAFLVVASRLAKIKLLSSWGLASKEMQELN